MADDVASLGFAVDSSQLVKATGELKNFNAEADKTTQRNRNIETAARNAGVSYDEMAKRVGNARENVAKIKADAQSAAQGLDASGAAAKRTGAAKRELNENVTELRAGLRTLSREAFLLPGPLGQVARVVGGVSYGMTPLTLGITASVAAFASVSAVVTAATIAYAHFEAQQIRVTNALASTGRGLQSSANDIERVVQQQSLSGTQSTDSLRKASLEVLRFRDISADVLPEVLSLSKDLAATGFVSLEQASQNVAKAITDVPEAGKIFEGMGLRLSDAAQRAANEMFGMGNRAGAARVLLAELSGQVGGADSRAAETLAASWGRLGNQTQKTFEDLGRHITQFLHLAQVIDAAATALERYNNSGQNSPGYRATNDRFKRAFEESARASNPLGFDAGLGDIGQTNKLGKAAGLDDIGRASTAADQTAERTARAAAEAEKLRQAWGGVVDQAGGVSNEVAKSLQATEDQLTVARAVGGANKINAQYAVDYAQATRDGSTEAEAGLQADLKRQVAIAQVSSAAQEQLAAMRDQQAVASAVTGVQQIQAQAQATYNSLIRQGVDEATAMATANQQVTNALAAANADADRMLKSLQQQGELIRASSEQEKEMIRARQTYNNLIDKGVDSQKAEAVASQQRANDEEERWKREREAADQALRNIRTREDAWNAYNRGAISWSVANDEAGKRAAASSEQMARAAAAAAAAIERENERIYQLWKWVPLSTTWAGGWGGTVLSFTQGKDVWESGGSMTQFNPSGYTSTIAGPASFAKTIGGLAGQYIDQKTGQPTSEGITKIVNDILGKGGSTTDAINALLNQKSGFGQTGGLTSGTLSMVQQLTDLLPDSDKASVINRELAQLKAQPQNIDTLNAIKTLTDSLNQLKQATDANTNALKISTDPLITQGHEYLNNLRIGYYHAASGFDGIARGGISGVDSIPFHAMVQDGERITITPRGMSPNVSNDNSRNVTNHITQNITLAGGGRDPRTAKQMAQGFIAAAVRAAG